MKDKYSPEEREEIAASRAAFENAGQVAAIDADVRAIKKLHNQIDTYFADEIDDPEWTELKRLAKYNFPDILHTKYVDLTPRQKLWAIAEVEGWSQSKFSKLSGTSRNSLAAWSKRADVLLFQRDYKQAIGSGDPHKVYSAQAHKALRFYEEVLDWKPLTVEEKQFKFKVATYVTDRAHGPIGKMDFSGIDTKKLAEEIRKASESVSDTDSYALFEE